MIRGARIRTQKSEELRNRLRIERKQDRREETDCWHPTGHNQPNYTEQGRFGEAHVRSATR